MVNQLPISEVLHQKRVLVAFIYIFYPRKDQGTLLNKYGSLEYPAKT